MKKYNKDLITLEFLLNEVKKQEIKESKDLNTTTGFFTTNNIYR